MFKLAECIVFTQPNNFEEPGTPIRAIVPNNMSSSQQPVCYIRRSGQCWNLGRVHHQNALKHFLKIPKSDDKTRIEVSHCDGKMFVAYFHHLENGVCQYIDESNKTVDIMMCTPVKAEYINRICTDC